MKCFILLVVAITAVVAASEEEDHFSEVQTGPSQILERRSVPDMDIPVESSEPIHKIVTRATGCSADGCNKFCRKLGHSRGVCIGSYCQCRF